MYYVVSYRRERPAGFSQLRFANPSSYENLVHWLFEELKPFPYSQFINFVLTDLNQAKLLFDTYPIPFTESGIQSIFVPTEILNMDDPDYLAKEQENLKLIKFEEKLRNDVAIKLENSDL